MRMSVKQLRAFLAVAHTLNFAHASERLNLSQPALSLTIKGLEEALGGALLQRSTRKVTLTGGELFLPMARQLLADWDNVEEAMRQSFTLQRGKISVAAMPSFAANVLPEALKAFRDRYAGVNVTVHDVINEQVIEMVREGGWRWASLSSHRPTTTCCLPRWRWTASWRLFPNNPRWRRKSSSPAGAVDPRLYYPQQRPRRYA